MNRFVVIVLAIIIIVGSFVTIATFFPGAIKPLCAAGCGANNPGQAPISVSQVSLEPGGSVQNNYLVNTYWDVNLAVNSIQNLAFLKLNSQGANGTAFTGNVLNGESFAPSSQVYVTLTPEQPYATVALKQIQAQWSPAASGYGDQVTEPATPCQNFGCYGASTNSTSAQIGYFFIPAQQYWTFHYPIAVTVTKVGGSDPFSQTETIDMVTQHSVTIADPSNLDENVTVNQIGFYAGDLSQVPVGDPIFYQGGSKCGGLCGFNNGQEAISQYANYWYGGLSNTVFQNSAGLTSPDTSYYNSACTNPGWGLTNVQQTDLGITTGNLYYYYPVAPSLTTPNSGYYFSYNLPGANPAGATYVKNYVCAGQDLTDWLNGQEGGSNPSVTTFSNPYGQSLPWQVSTQQLSINLPYSEFSSLLIPSMQVLVSTSLADTVVYQVNGAQFQISSVSTSNSVVTGPGSATINVGIKNVGSYAGTPTISAVQSTGSFSISPPSQSIPSGIAPGGSGNVTFSATGLDVQSSTKDSITFYVSNDAGQVTDSKSISLTENPAPTLGTQKFSLSGVNAPSSIAVGDQAAVTLEVQSVGAPGIAAISAISQDPQVLSINPINVNQSMGSGDTVPVGFTIVGVALPAGSQKQNVTLVFTVGNGSQNASQEHITVTVFQGSSVCLTNCPPSSTVGGISYALIAIIAAVVAVAAIGAGYIIHKRRS